MIRWWLSTALLMIGIYQIVTWLFSGDTDNLIIGCFILTMLRMEQLADEVGA